MNDRSASYPELTGASDLDLPSPPSPSSPPSPLSNDTSLQGVAANVKLLLKILQDHNNAFGKEDDGRQVQRLSGMISILDDIKVRIQKSQTFRKKRQAELRRCFTDLRRAPTGKKPQEFDEKQRLQKELNECLAARKSLEKMFSSLGKEKEIMSTELTRKVQELNAAEEQLNDLKSQNTMLLAKLHNYAAKLKEKSSILVVGTETQGNTALQERNKALSEQLLKSLDGYRSLKRKMKEVQEENAGIRTKMIEMEQEITVGLDRIHAFQEHHQEDDLSALEHVLHSLEETVLSSKRSNSAKSLGDHKEGSP